MLIIIKARTTSVEIEFGCATPSFIRGVSLAPIHRFELVAPWPEMHCVSLGTHCSIG